MDPDKIPSSSTSCVAAEVVSSTTATATAATTSKQPSSDKDEQPPRKGPRYYPPGKGKSVDELFEDIARGLERWEKRLPPHERSRFTSQFNSAKARAARKKAAEEANRKDPNRIQYGWQLRDQLLNSTYVPPEPPKPPPKQLKFEPSRFTFNPGEAKSVAVSSNDGTTKEVDMMDNNNSSTDDDADAQKKKQGAFKFGSQCEGSYIDGTNRNPMEEDDEGEIEASVNVKKKKSPSDPLFADLFTSPSAKAAAKRYTVGSNSAAIYEKIQKEAEEKKRKEREEREKNKVDPIEAFKEKARKNGTSGYCPFPIYGYNMFGQPKCSPEDAERLAAFAKKWIATPIPGERKKSTEAEKDDAAKSEGHE